MRASADSVQLVIIFNNDLFVTQIFFRYISSPSQHQIHSYFVLVFCRRHRLLLLYRIAVRAGSRPTINAALIYI